MDIEKQIEKIISKSANAAQISNGLSQLGHGSEKEGIKVLLDYAGKNGMLKGGMATLTAVTIVSLIVILLKKMKLNKEGREIVNTLEKSMAEENSTDEDNTEISDIS
ncbi:MAG: hypothetical protein IJG23_04795 [Clostridia bacterium]|nr:hypothetical protein [Clostridia bacterium]